MTTMGHFRPSRSIRTDGSFPLLPCQSDAGDGRSGPRTDIAESAQLMRRYSFGGSTGVLVSTIPLHLGQVNTCNTICSAATRDEWSHFISILQVWQSGEISLSLGPSNRFMPHVPKWRCSTSERFRNLLRILPNPNQAKVGNDMNRRSLS